VVDDLEVLEMIIKDETCTDILYQAVKSELYERIKNALKHINTKDLIDLMKNLKNKEVKNG